MDPEGHVWNFTQEVREVSTEEMARPAGRKIASSLKEATPWLDWRSPLMSAVVYRDPKAALKFLEAAFGFELFMLIEDDAGNLAHSEMRFGEAAIMVGYEWSDELQEPGLDRRQGHPVGAHPDRRPTSTPTASGRGRRAWRS